MHVTTLFNNGFFLFAADTTSAPASATAHPQLQFLGDLAIVLLIAGFITVLFRLLKQPVVLGYILAGAIIGPNTPPFKLVGDDHTVHIFSELGVILLMFGLGLHFSLRKLAQVGATAFIAATFEILGMLLIGYVVGKSFGWSNMDSIFLGAILSISSTTIIIKALQELGLVKKAFAQLIFGILIVEDILGIAMLAILPGVAQSGTLSTNDLLLTLGKLSTFLAVTLIFGLLLVPRLLRFVDKFKSNEMLLITSLALCFGVAWVASLLGYSVALGAFLIGAVVAEAREHHKIDDLVTPVRDIFSAVFFVSIGMLIDPKILWEYALPIAVITAAVILGKVLTCTLGTFAAGNDTRTSLRVGMGLAQIGEFSFIIAALGQQLKVTSDFIYPVTVAVSAVTTLLTPYLIKSADPLVAQFDKRAPKSIKTFLDTYSTWLTRKKHDTGAPGPRQMVRKLSRKWILQILLNMTVVTALFIAATYLNNRFAGNPTFVPAWLGGTRGGLWLVAAVLSLPLLVASLRKLRALGMLLAEASVPNAAGKTHTAPLRAVITNVILSVGTALILLWILVLSSAMLPPWPVLLAILGIVILIALAMWQRLIRLYSKAQISIRETLTTPHDHPHKIEDIDDAPLPGILKQAEILSIEITETSPAAGKLVRDLNLRYLTGASIVAIDRSTSPIINPGPNEELRPGDHLLLLALPDQLDNAKKILTPQTAS
jgi:CPA2 family monovalent cation:H+ antiporter-2